VLAVSPYPLFDLRNPSTALVLSTIRDLPIRLYSALTSDLVASYPLINTTTEAYVTPHSLVCTNDGSRFIAGSDSLISTFDLSRPGQGPVASFQTGRKKRNLDHLNPGTTMRGIVSTLAIDPISNVLAAGTFNRNVALYDSGGHGECIGVFSVRGAESDKSIGGQGITQVLWSPCGRYLYIAERKSYGMIMYDIRKTGQLLGWLTGRQAYSNQRMSVDIMPAGEDGGYKIWAGGIDGSVGIWENPHLQQGPVGSSTKWRAHAIGDTVCGVSIHRGGGVVATASGHRQFEPLDQNEPSGRTVDSSLKLWQI